MSTAVSCSRPCPALALRGLAVVAAFGLGLLPVLTVTAPVAGSPPAAHVDELAWLAGTWIGETDGVRNEEIWTPPAGGVLLGLHRDVKEGRPAFFEFLRIEQTDAGPVYLASPAGRPAKGFPLVESGASHAVFANPEHDFPQKLTYRRDGDRLHVRAEGEDDGGGRRVLEWVWELRDRCPGTHP